MEKQFGILFTSRNNYVLLDQWCSEINANDYYILNIDEDSTQEQKELGKKICKKHNITYLDREERGMLFNLQTASNHFIPKGFSWILYFSHDCFPKGDNFFDKLNTYLNEKDLSDFGTVGFNILHGDQNPNILKEYKAENTPLHFTARTPLEPGDLYYRNNRYYPNTRVRYDEKFNKPFAVEIIMWTAGLLNIKQFQSHITPTGEYHMFHSWDDMCFQFLYNNVYNIVLPQFHLAHEQETKVKFGIPKSSPGGDPKVREHYFSKWGSHEVWESRWGFPYGGGSRDKFELIKDQYKGTLLWEFYHHDPINGPLKSFNI